MEKYYTPTIEEFHVGFEYEIMNSENAQWGSFLIKTSDDLINKFMRDEDEVRVKYLDRKDIESLGFTHTGGKLSSYGEQYYTKKTQIGINHFETIEIIYMQHKVSIKRKEDSGYDNSWYTKFDGIIKNKSELKKLLKQLKIIE